MKQSYAFIKMSSFICLLLIGAQAMAQTDNVGIGTTTPEPSAILDVSNPYNVITGTPAKGMLVPSMNQLQRNSMLSAYNDTLANGLLIYETDSGNFWYYKYNVPTPLTAPFGAVGKGGNSASGAKFSDRRHHHVVGHQCLHSIGMEPL
jgi:hypothetical protein